MADFRLGYVPGVFDLLHEGHLNLLRRAREQCDLLAVGVVSDAGCEAYKGKRPVQHEDTRLEVIRNLRMVSCGVMQATTDPTPNLHVLRPQALFHGDDWTRLLEGQETLEALGIAFVLLPYTPGVSTSLLRERMAA
jgi:glycerol-3-phosphate cytidylyltransferase